MIKKNSLLVLVPVLLAVLIANLLTPFIYRNVSSDFGRTQLILKALDSQPAPDIVLLGNSILMSGIDAKHMSNSLNNELVYNFGSNGQTLKESFLYYPKIPKSTKRILQFIRIEDFETSLKDLEEPVLRNFALYGYSYNPEVETLLGNKELAYLTKNRLAINFDARIIVTNVMNRSFRRVLRKDLNLEDAENDLFFPNVYAQRVDPETYALDIEKFNPSRPLTQFTINENTVRLLIRAKEYFRQRNMDYKIVLYPVNPDLFNYTNDYKKNAQNKIQQSGLQIINCINILDGTDFVDYWHISRPGAYKFTNSLVKQLNAF